MSKGFLKYIFPLVVLATSVHAGERKRIPPGRFSPLYGIEKSQKDFPINAFFLDVYPVTVSDYKKFLEEKPEWKKENVSALFADRSYLSKINSPENSPMVSISWFSANAYCESKGGRLPSTLEWEYVAAATEKKKDALGSKELTDRILSWYSKPEVDGVVLEIGKNRPNYYGIHDLHGLIWEWTADFNSVIMTTDNRSDGDKSESATCGAGSLGAKTREDYAGFVRYSLRNSLEAKFTLINLGFRCAYEK